MRSVLHGVVLTVIGMSLAADGRAQEHPTAIAASLAAYHDRIRDYISLRDRITRTVPEVRETGDPAKISARERDLGLAIAAARQGAEPGDIFGGLTSYLQRVVSTDWRSRSAADRTALFEEIPPGLKLRVNQPYPPTIPLVTVPAKLLAALPALPEALEYRLVDRRLLLRDRDANLIVDVVDGIPPGRRR